MAIGSGDITGFKVLFVLSILYGLISCLVYSFIHMKLIEPLGFDAPLDRFSEARAIEHVRVLSEDIGGRQEGSPGLRKAAEYIKTQLEMIKERAGPNYRIEIEETTANGSFTTVFLGQSLSQAYRNLTNILMRISSMDSQDSDPSVLLNSHFDTPPGSPGAGDCGSCVASLLELARLTVDSGWVPPRPVIFLFNGAEELFVLGSHGFMTTNKWRDTIGAFINVEAFGTGGIDLVCRSGPGSWPSSVYAKSAVYPMANSAAPDFFGAIPGDTDYRMFAEDFGDIPGLDNIFLLGGYFYHTSSDTVDRLLPGSMQVRGENLFSSMKAFTDSSELRNAQERKSLREATGGFDNERAIFFDYYSQLMVFYTKRKAEFLHSIPIAMFLLMPLILRLRHGGLFYSLRAFWDFTKGLLYHAANIVLAVVVPVIFAILRLLFSGHSMHWFANQQLAFMLFVPCSLIGLLLPGLIFRQFPLSQDASTLAQSKEELIYEARFWGAFGFYSIFTVVFLASGLGGGFVTFTISAFMLPAWILFRLSVKFFKYQSLRSTASYGVPLIPCVMHSVYLGGLITTFLIEKMGMSGSLPPPYGYFIPDVIVAAVIGVVTGLCVGPLLPVVGNWLSKVSVIGLLLHATVIALAVSSQFFPYSKDAPKRVVLQHTVEIGDADNMMFEASFDFAVLDSNSLMFVFRHAPEVVRELNIDDSEELSFETISASRLETWKGIFPISSLFSRSLNFPTSTDEISQQYTYLPHLFETQQVPFNDGRRRVDLEFSLGSLEEVWVVVLNITGPLSNWSFADNVLPAPVSNGHQSYICRLSGSSADNWKFWLEANSSEALRVETAAVDLRLTDSTKKLKSLFPQWMDYWNLRKKKLFGCSLSWWRGCSGGFIVTSSMDWQGQKLVEKLTQLMLVVFAHAAFVTGYTLGSFQAMLFVYSFGVMLTSLITIHNWSFFNCGPLNWLDANEAEIPKPQPISNKNKHTRNKLFE